MEIRTHVSHTQDKDDILQTYPQLCIDQDVLILDITMDNPLSVQVPDCLNHLLEHKLGLMFRKPFSRGLLDAFEKIVRRSSP